MTQEIINDLQETRVLADSLLKIKHYQRLGPEGIFAIVQKAKAIKIHPLEALNGGMYYVQRQGRNVGAFDESAYKASGAFYLQR
jgi:hypothetical protein